MDFTIAGLDDQNHLPISVADPEARSGRFVFHILRGQAGDIAFSKMKGNLVERSLFPLFRFFKPEGSMFGIELSAFSANKFLLTDFNDLIHELRS
jgi:hypothetical protein